MKPIYTIVDEIRQQLNGDNYNLIYGNHGRQNIEVDEKDFTGFDGVILLDEPTPSPPVNNFLGVEIFNQSVTIAFAFPQENNVDLTQDYINILQERAKASARQFFLRLRQYRDPSLNIQNLTHGSPLLFDSFLDICLCGASFTFNITISDAGSICV